MKSETTTGPVPAQHLMSTSVNGFFHQDVNADGVRTRPLLCVQAGQDCEAAMNQASMLLGSADEIMTLLTEEGIETNTIYGLRFLIETSKALMESSITAVLAAKKQGAAR